MANAEIAMESAKRALKLLVFPSHNLQVKEVLQSFGTFFKKEKKELRIQVFCNSEDLQQGIGSNKNLNFLIKEGLINFQPLEEGADLRELLDETCKASDEDVIICSDFHLQSINAMYAEWLKNKAPHEGIAVLSHHSEDKKKAISFKNKLAHAGLQIFGIQSDFDLYNSFLLGKASALTTLLSDTKQKAKDFSALMSLCSALLKLKAGITETRQLSLNEALNAEHSLLKGKLKGLTQGISMRWWWFFSLPLAQIKRDGLKDAGDYKHPIYRFAFLLLSLFLMILMPAMSFGFGILWDEPDHINYANDVLNYFKSFGADRSVFDETKRIYFAMKVYGISFDTFSAFVYQTISPLGVYETRHFLNALVGGVGMIYAGLLARYLGGWRAGVIALFVIFISPYFLGHSMNNHKDIPFATGFIMAIYYMIVWLNHLPKPRFRDFTWLIIGIGLVCSVRIGGIIVVAFTGLFTGVYWLYLIRNKGFSAAMSKVIPFAFYMLLIGTLGFILGILPWPYGLENPLKHPFEALTVFTNFQLLTIYELFEGQRTYMNEVPWYYIPKFISITSPLVVLLALPVSVIAWFKKQEGSSRPLIWAVLFSIVFPVAYAVYKDSTLYNGWRHFLFIYPALVAVSALGWEFLFRNFKQKGLRIGLSFVFLVLSAKTIYWIVDNHPNEYTYYNEFVGGYDGAFGYYESDPYGNAMRQGIDWLYQNELKGFEGEVRIGVNMTPPTASYYAKKYNENTNVSWLDDDERYRKDWDYAILAPREFSHSQLTNGAYPPKGTIHVIKVENSPLLAIVKAENDFMTDGYLASDKGDYRTAATHFAKAVDYDPMNEEARRMLGMSYLNTMNMEQAGEQLLKAIEINPESFMAHSLLGIYYLRMNRTNEAIASLKKSIEYKVNFGNSYLQLGQIYYNTGNFAEAEKYFDKSLDHLNPTPQILNQMAANLIQLGKNDKAIQYLSAALNLDPNYAEAYRALALAYEKLGNKGQAQAFMQKFRELGGQ